MKFTLSELRVISPSIARLTSKELPLKLSYRLSRFLRKVTDELSIVEQERIRLVEKMGVESEGKIIIPAEKSEEFKKVFGTLLAEEIDIDIAPVSLGELGDIQLSPQDLMNLEKIIIVEPE